LQPAQAEEVTMTKLALAGLLLATVCAAAGGAQDDAQAGNAQPPAPSGVTDSQGNDDLRARIVDIQQSLDRILAETTPAPVGTRGAARGTPTDAPPRPGGTVAVDRERLLRLRRQLDALLARLP
jgi:hypothetical protein